MLGYYAALEKLEQLAASPVAVTEKHIQTLHALVMAEGRIMRLLRSAHRTTTTKDAPRRTLRNGWSISALAWRRTENDTGTRAENRMQFRHMYQRLYKPLLSHSFFLFVARGTGKTHLLQSLFKNHKSVLWIDLLPQGEVLQFLRSANELGARLDGLTKPPSFVVIISLILE